MAMTTLNPQPRFGSPTPPPVMQQYSQMLGAANNFAPRMQATQLQTSAAPDLTRTLESYNSMLGGLNLAEKPKPTYETTVQPNTKKTGGSGRAAYGHKGITGLPEHRGTGKLGLQQPFATALDRMNADMKAAGIGGFGITDGFRSYEAQVDVKRRKPNLAATPGTSIHGLGYAADLKVSKAQSNWIAKNGARYGVYLPMPTKEPWHVQFRA